MGNVDFGFKCSGTPSVCTSECGDGLLASSEECDDKNDEEDDGCFECLIESGYTCTLESPSVCTMTKADQQAFSRNE